MHIENTYRYKNIIEVERVHSGRYGRRIPNGARRRPTTEEQRRINERTAARKLRRKIHANFSEDDLFMTLTYQRGERPEAEEARKRLGKLLRQCRKAWKEARQALKYIAVTEYRGKAIHHHIIVNDLQDGSGAKKINQCWKKNGRAHTSYLYDAGGYEKLAEYLMKETSKTFRESDAPCKARYSCSKNLITPEKKTRILKRDNWPEEPRAPKGYYLEKGSLYNGINKAGYRYQYYRLIAAESRAGAVRKRQRAAGGGERPGRAAGGRRERHRKRIKGHKQVENKPEISR